MAVPMDESLNKQSPHELSNHERFFEQIMRCSEIKIMHEAVRLKLNHLFYGETYSKHGS